jgi:hypothetical protein
MQSRCSLDSQWLVGASREKIARQFIDAFNRRDVEGLVVLCDPDVEFRPTSLVADHEVYRGHDGLRRWGADLVASGLEHQARVREIRMLDEDGFLAITEVLLDDELVSPSAMLARLGEGGGIVELDAYLTDEETLGQVGLIEP